MHWQQLEPANGDEYSPLELSQLSPVGRYTRTMGAPVSEFGMASSRRVGGLRDVRLGPWQGANHVVGRFVVSELQARG